MHFPPVTWWHAFPDAKCPSKGIRVFEAEQVRSFVKLQSGVAEVVAGHLVTSLIKQSLIVGPGILQTAL